MINPPLLNHHHREHSTRLAFKLVWFLSLAFVGCTLCGEDPTQTVEPNETEDSVNVQPNGYFEFSTEHSLHDKVVSYGDLVDIIDKLTKEKLMAFLDDENTLSQATNMTTSESNKKPVSTRTARTWKRRILVLLDGERVTGTADIRMKIEKHLGASLDTIKSLEGFLSTDVEANERAYPRVLNFVSETPNHQEMDPAERNELESEKTQT